MTSSRHPARALRGLLLASLMVSSTFAAKPSEYDAVSSIRPRGQAHAAADSIAWRLVEPGSRTQFDARFGVPTFVWARRSGKAQQHSPLAGVPAAQAARSHLSAFAPLYGLDASDVQSAVAGPVHDTGRGAVIVGFGQVIDGLEVFRDEIRIAMDRSHDLISISGFLTDGTRVASASRPFVFNLSPAEAIAIAMADLMDVNVAASAFTRSEGMAGGYESYTIDPEVAAALGRSVEPVRVKKVLFHLPGRYEPAFYVELMGGSADETGSLAYAYVVSADDGRLLFRHDLTASDTFTYRVWADPAGVHLPMDGPQGNGATPHPTGLPDGFQAAFVAPVLITLQNGPISTNDPWLTPTTSTTIGNNVDAYADLVSPDGFTSSGDMRAPTTGTRTFDRTYDTTQSPQASQTQRLAAVTQLFYANNFFHDWYYDSGFNEIWRNAQTNNYGRGGLGNDSIRAEAQDYSGRNNADMSTPADGGRPRMQMYVFDGNGLRLVTVNTPASIAGPYTSGLAAFGPAAFDVTNDVVLVNDGSGAITDGCEAPFANAAAVSGKIVLIDRGTCTFVSKVKNAQNAGAVGVIIANNTTGVITMGGTDATITTPSLMISQADGNTLKIELSSGVNANLYRELAIDRDGTIDNQIVAHEWGHFISNRLIGNANGLNTNMGGGLGEGWADFHAVLMTVRPEDTLVTGNDSYQGVYGLAGYVTSGGANQGYYFGIRRVPYSTDFSRNPLTFRHIADGVPLPTTVPIAFGADGSNNAEVHNAGEVWATMLWECYAALLRDTLGSSPRLTFQQARDRMKDYLVAAYKLTPSSPTLLEARDALLAAAGAADPVDRALFHQAFARRGAGIGAIAPDRFSLDNNGVVESFIPGDDLVLTGASANDDVSTLCLPDGVLDDGETGHLTLTLLNTGGASLTSTTATVTSPHPGISFPAGNAITFPASSPSGTTTASIEVSLSGAIGIEAPEFSVTYDDPGLLVPGPRVVTTQVRVNADDHPAQSAVDDVESDSPAWTPGYDPSLDVSRPWERLAENPMAHHWYGPDTGASSDHYLVSPALNVAPAGSFSFTFNHRYLFESSGGTDYDGGVIEISVNNGPWSDIGGSASPGYTGTLDVGGLNPIEGRSAYTGTSPGYPAWNTVTVSLGTAYQGQSVRVRFRIGTDIGVGAIGWEIDDIAFGNITNLPFNAVLPHDGTCDIDTDGVFDTLDCAPLDTSLWAPSSEALDLTLDASSPTTLSWSAPAAPGAAAGVVYDVLRSDGAAAFSSAACALSGGSGLTMQDPDDPAMVFYYLVRARNGCGGSLGAGSAGSPPRTGTVCP